MKGITPVIAIILLLLMAVAAAGGFYIVYQNFASSGEESGSSQIQTLGETSLTQLTIESVAAGKIYVRNVGASTIDGSKLTVYVENVPYEVNVSTSSIEENSRATLKFTSVPTCTSEKCEVKVSGPASASRSIEQAKLSCASDGECGYGESCYLGVCIAGEVSSGCGNGVCDEGEYGWSCFVDCHPESIILPGWTWFTTYSWNGTTYSFTSNFTPAVYGYQGTGRTSMFLSNGNHIFSGIFAQNEQGTGGGYCWYSKYDGSSWSHPYNLSNDYKVSPEPWLFGSSDADSAGNAMFVWRHRPDSQPLEKVQWAMLINGAPTEVNNATNWLNAHPYSDLDLNYANPSFVFSSDDNGHLFYANKTEDAPEDNRYKVLTRSWDGSSFSAPVVVFNQLNSASLSGVLPPLVSFSDNGDGVAVWMAKNSTNHRFMKYATYEGAWSYQGNFQEFLPDNDTQRWATTGLEHDHTGDAVLVMSALGPDIIASYVVYNNGAWGQEQSMPEGTNKTLTHLHRTSDNTLFAMDVDFNKGMLGERDCWRWMVWNGNGWSEPVYVGPFE